MNTKSPILSYYDKTSEQKTFYLNQLMRDMESGSDDLLKKMQRIVNRTLKGFIADFYIHDVSLIKECDRKPFLWVVRDYGTHFIHLCSDHFIYDSSHEGVWGNSNYFNSIVSTLKNELRGFYLYEDNKLKKINKEQAVATIQKYEQYMRNKVAEKQ